MVLLVDQSVAQQPTNIADEDLRQTLKDVRGDDLEGKDGPLAKIGTDLALLHRNYDEHQRQGKAAGTYRPPKRVRPMVRVQNGHVTIDAIAATGQGDALLTDLRERGLKNGAQVDRLVSGRIPIDRLDEVAALSSMHSARPAAATTVDGKTVSQGDPAMLSDDVRASQDLNGEGVTVGVLSDTYDKANAATTAQDDIDSGDLPPASKINILDDSQPSGTDEGRAMMQIIHDVAPGASQAFHTAFGGRANFAQGIRDLANAGSDVVVDDIIYFNEPMFQAGIIAQAADDINSQGVAYFSSAGNSARQSYKSDDYEETGAGGFEFDPASGDTTQSISSGGDVTLSFQWDDPYASAGGQGADTDLDIFLLDENGDVVGSSESDNIGGDPVELLNIPSGDYQIYIKRASGPVPSTIKYVYFGDLTIQEYATQSPSSYGHANAAGAVAVGAAYYQDTPEFGTSPPEPEGFSSVGGVPIFFNKDGSRKSSPVVRDKPEITAPDGVNTTFFGQDSDGDGFPNFFGTSAASPHAAALTALQIDDNSSLSPADILSNQQSSAIDMDAPGFDNKTGAGLVQAPEAIGAPSGGTDLAVSVFSISPPDPNEGDRIEHVATVCNEGGSAAGASTLEFKVADEPNPPIFSIPALDPSHCESVERTRQLSEGSYQNRAVADVNDAVSESDETNNETTITYEVGPPAVPDLVVASIDNTPQNPTIKDEVTFEVEVCNGGTGGAGSSQVEFKIGEEESPPKLSLPSIPAGQCSVAERTEQLTEPGEYQTVATANIDDQVNETDETNNVREGTVTVEVGELVVTHNQIDRFDFPEVTNFVSVTTTLGDPVENLGPSNFDIEENSTPQSGLSVENVGESGPSLSVSLVVDRSGSMEGTRLSEAKAAAKSFTENLGSSDKAALVSFAGGISVDQSFTANKEAVQSATDGLTAGGRSAFYGAVAEGIARADAQASRTAIVALVDGRDDESSVAPQEVVEQAQREDQPVFAIGLGDSFDEDEVQSLARETGGRFFQVSSPSNLSSVYTQILELLQNQYRITYGAGDDARDGTVRTVGVTASRDDATGTDQRGYRALRTNFALPSLTIEDAVPVQLTSLGRTVFESLSNGSLTLSATSSDENVATVARENGRLVLAPQAEGDPVRIEVTASDDTSQAQAAFALTIDAAPEDSPVPSAAAVAPVASDGAIGFGRTGIDIVPTDVSGGPDFLAINFFAEENAAPSTGKSAQMNVGLDDYENVSPYRWEMSSGSLLFGDETEVRIRIDSLPGDQGGIGDPSSVDVLLDSTSNGEFEALPTSVDENGTPGDITDDQLRASGASQLGTFRLASDSTSNPLPVEMTAFRASLDGTAAVLQWETSSETDNAGFEVQRQGPDASGYVDEGFVEGAGTTNEPQQYRFRAEELETGEHQFRLRQVDTEGTATLSDPVTVRVRPPRVLSLEARGSNPVRSTIRLSFTVPKTQAAQLSLYNVLGQRVQVLHDQSTQAGDEHVVTVSTGRLSSGVYFAHLSTPSGTRTRKIVVVE